MREYKLVGFHHYKGFVLRLLKSVDELGGHTCEIWKDGRLCGFAPNCVDAEIIVDRGGVC